MYLCLCDRAYVCGYYLCWCVLYIMLVYVNIFVFGVCACICVYVCTDVLFVCVGIHAFGSVLVFRFRL